MVVLRLKALLRWDSALHHAALPHHAALVLGTRLPSRLCRGTPEAPALGFWGVRAYGACAQWTWDFWTLVWAQKPEI